MPRSNSRKHQDAQKVGTTLVVRGTSTPVLYRPRKPKDDKPWIDSKGNRYAARDIDRTVI